MVSCDLQSCFAIPDFKTLEVHIICQDRNAGLLAEFFSFDHRTYAWKGFEMDRLIRLSIFFDLESLQVDAVPDLDNISRRDRVSRMLECPPRAVDGSGIRVFARRRHTVDPAPLYFMLFTILFWTRSQHRQNEEDEP